MDVRFKPKAGRFGVMPVFLTGRQLDAGITASATVQVPLATPYRKMFIARLTIFPGGTLPIGGSAITAVFQKKPVGAGAVALSAATDLKVSGQTSQVASSPALLATLTDAQRILNEGDALYVDVIAAGTVTTQPTFLSFIVEAYALE